MRLNDKVYESKLHVVDVHALPLMGRDWLGAICRGGQYRGTFLVPLSVPSLLFKNCTVFGTVDTFFAILSSLLGTICGMEFK